MEEEKKENEGSEKEKGGVRMWRNGGRIRKMTYQRGQRR